MLEIIDGDLHEVNRAMSLDNDVNYGLYNNQGQSNIEIAQRVQANQNSTVYSREMQIWSLVNDFDNFRTYVMWER